MSRGRKDLGDFGEELAARFLAQKGGKIIDRNFFTRFGEIDLVAQLGDEVLFVEVKTRSSAEYGYPEEAVDASKVDHLTKAIGIYLAQKRLDKFWRLDVISVELDKASRRAKVRWFKNVSMKY